MIPRKVRRNPSAVIDRRRFLLGAGGAALSLPFLEYFGSTEARAQTVPAPTRLVVVMHGEGTMNDQWTPSTTGSGFQMSSLLAPLAAHRDRLTVISGLSNEVATEMGGNAHNKAGRSLLTAQTFSGGGENGPANGPSIDQVIAQRIGVDSVHHSVNLQISDAGVGEYQLLFAAKDDPVGAISDPREAFDTLFSKLPDDPTGAPPPPPVLSLREKLRAHRPGVLHSVNDSFRQLISRVGVEDRARLQLHAEKIAELERLARASAAPPPPPPVAACGRPILGLPADFDQNRSQDHLAAIAQMKNAAMALACGLTRVVTVQFTDYDGPTFPWTGADIPGGYSDWHAMIHRDGGVLPGRDQAVAIAMNWYSESVTLLLDELASFDEGGSTLLDNTLVVWVSEFGDGGSHDTHDLPVVLAGNLGGRIHTGQHLSFSGQNRTTNDLFVTLLNAFGFDDTEFGYGGSSYNKGALAGVVV